MESKVFVRAELLKREMGLPGTLPWTRHIPKILFVHTGEVHTPGIDDFVIE